jgi:F0F1-type ATP synthase membrane subunit b/b'
MILIGLLITFGLLVGVIFLFSYGKFHDIVNELKRDVQFKNEANQKNINDLKQKLNEYDVLLKQV